MNDTQQIPIVTIGGGAGQFMLLSGLRDVTTLTLTSVVSMVDSGGSTGRLRDELGVLPPGDILKCILALSPERETMRRLLLSRFKQSERLRGHSAGNMLLTMLSTYTGSFSDGVAALAEISNIRGTVLPVTVDRATLVAELKDGTKVFGEAAIDVNTNNNNSPYIKQAYLVPHHGSHIAVHPPVIKAIEQAQYIIIGPGDVYTSIIPNLLVPGVAEALQTSSAKLVYILNIMTKHSETNHFRAPDFVQAIESHIGRRLDVVVANNRMPSGEQIMRYGQKLSEVVLAPDATTLNPRSVVAGDILEDHHADLLRHNSKRLTALLCSKVFNIT